MSHFQKALPVEDTYADSAWLASFPATTDPDPYPPTIKAYPDLFSAINDESDDAWIISDNQPSNVAYVAKLTQLVNPEDLEGDWTVKVRVKKASSSGVPVNITVELYQQYDAGGPGPSPYEVIASQTFNDIPSTLTEYEIVVPDHSFVLDTMLLYVRIVADS